MEIKIIGSAKEIADLMVALQSQLDEEIEITKNILGETIVKTQKERRG